MVRLHVVYHQILHGAVAQDALYLVQVGLEVTCVHSVDKCHDVVGYEVRIVGDSVGQRPHALEEVLVAVVHTHVVYLSFYQCLVFH